MRRHSGFTLIELVVTVAIAGIIASAAIAFWRSAVKNAASGDAAFDIAARLGALRPAAMRDGRTWVGVVVDAAGNDPSKCSFMSQFACAATCVLSDVQTGFDIKTFKVGVPPTGAVLDECIFYGNGVRFQTTSPPTPPPPFDGFVVNDPLVVQALNDGRTALAVRFEPDGSVYPFLAGGATTPPPGVVLSVGSNAVAAAAQREVVVTFPFGMIRTFGF